MGWNNTAPPPHGPGFVRQDLSVKAKVVFTGDSIIISMTIFFLQLCLFMNAGLGRT